MRICRGADDRLLMFVLALLVCGCLVQPGGNAKPKPGKQTIADLSFAECQARDAAVAAELDKVAADIEAGELQYDAKLQERLGSAFKAGDNTIEAKAVSAAMARVLSAGSTFDKSNASKAIKALADGRRRAAK